MKKQYIFRRYEDRGDYHTIHIYHDGEFITGYGLLDANEASNRLNQLKKEGYEPAFIDEDIEAAKNEYEYMLEHRLMKREKK